VAEKGEVEEVKCSKCGRTGVPIAKMKLTHETSEYICVECVEK